MRYNIKQIMSIFTVCSLLVLGGCTQEKDFVNEHNHRNIDFKEKSFKEALSLPLFNDALKKVAKQKGALRSEDAARTALEDQYGFTIVEDAPVKIITNENGTVFYTLLVDRDVKENLKFENLIIKVQNNETTAALFKYTMADKAVKIEEHESYILNIIDKELTDLNVDGKIFINAGGETCITTEVLMCNATWSGQPFVHLAEINCMIHQATYGTNSIYTTSSSICYGGTNLTNSSVVINTAGGGVPNEPIVTSPTPCRTGNCIEADETPCSELKNILKTPSSLPTLSKSIKKAIEDNYQALVAPGVRSHEEGYDFYFDCATKQMFAKPATIGAENMVKYRRNSNVFGGTHFHQEDLVEMFSHDDIAQLLQFKIDFGQSLSEECKQSANYPVPMHLMQSHLGTYALMIENEALFTSTLTPIYTNEQLRSDFRYQLEDEYKHLKNNLNNTWSTNRADYEDILLKFITNIDNDDNYNLGIGLYRAIMDLNGKVLGWEKLTIKKKANTTNEYEIIATPC